MDMIEFPAQRFCTMLYKTLLNQPGNMLISPLSLEILIGVIQKGARGETEKEIENAVASPLNIEEATQESFDTIMGIMKTDSEGIMFEMANKIYIDSQFALEPDFLTIAQTEFVTDIESVDIKSKPQECLKTINMGVYEKTRRKIRDLLSEGDITPDTKMLLVNALYFKGKWNTPFPKKNTKKGDFYVTPSVKKKVDMMHCRSSYGYATFEEEKAKMAMIPYAGEKNFMVIILPNEIEGLHDLEINLPITTVMEAVISATLPEMDVWLPRFKIETKIDMKENFELLGIQSMFNAEKADLRGISEDKGLCVAKILHKMSIEVNEEGVEQAASKRDVVGPITDEDSEITEFRVDHPFIFLLLNVESACVLFVGRVLSP